MNIEEFCKKNNCKEKRKTINEWLKKGYIRGAKQNEKTKEWYIPTEAMIPYTRHGRPSGTAMYKSIAKGVSQNRDVFAALYGISEMRFKQYTDIMIEKGYLKAYESEGITYYVPTLETEKFINMPNSKIIATLGELASKIVSETVNVYVKNKMEK